MVKKSSPTIQSRLSLPRWRLLVVLVLGAAFPTLAFIPYQYGLPKPTFPSSITVCYMATAKAGSKTTVRKTWNNMYPRLRDYKESFGHTNVTKEDDPDLYEWVRKLRQNYSHQARNETDSTGKRGRLAPKKLQLLQDLGFAWEPGRTIGKRARWVSLTERLKNYKATHGHTYVDKDDDDEELYKWVKHLRYNYRHQALNASLSSGASSRTLSAPKMKTLQEIGFDWDLARRYRSWHEMLPRLQAYKEKHGHTHVKKTDDVELYEWITVLIQNYGPQLSNKTTSQWRRRLPDEKMKQLRDLEFSVANRSSKWDLRYEELRAFRRKHGHCHPLRRDNPPLANFVQNQRREFRRYLAGNATTLTTERIQALKKIQFVWARPHKVAWEERRGDLEVYQKNHGHANVPQDFQDNYQLGQWCMNQRTNFRIKNAGERNGMTEGRIRKLEKVNFHWSPKGARWYVMAERLKQYQEENGHIDIPTADTENNDLRLWLTEQRFFYNNRRDTRLNAERIEILESIPDFSWRKKRRGPSKGDWSDLFVAIREKGITPEGKTKQHIFDGAPRFDNNVKTEWTEQELLALWNEETEDDEDEESDFDVDEGQFFEDEASRKFLRA